MKLRVKTFKMKATKDELVAMQLAIQLMVENEMTHYRWKKTLGPVNDQMKEALGMDYE